MEALGAAFGCTLMMLFGVAAIAWSAHTSGTRGDRTTGAGAAIDKGRSDDLDALRAEVAALRSERGRRDDPTASR